MDFATEDFSNLLLARTACQKQECMCAVFTHTTPKKEKKKNKKDKDRLTFGDFEPRHTFSN